VAAGHLHTAGLCSDGRVLFAGSLEGGEDIGAWRDVVALASGSDRLLALHADGSVSVAGALDHAGEEKAWSDVVALGAGAKHSLAVRSDGRVLATGENRHGQLGLAGTCLRPSALDHGQESLR
jgi:alpha-tubulin suppressor-like RCC1 family protein